MPNNVINEIIFRHVNEPTKDFILALACTHEGEVDFEKLVPTPLNMWWHSVSSEHERAFGRTSLSWNRENWGTKWNAYGHQPVERPNDVLVLRFQTAWSPPYPWLAALFNSVKLGFDHNWLDEGADRGVCGIFKMEGAWGPEWKEQPAPDYMQRHLHKLLWGVETFDEDEPA